MQPSVYGAPDSPSSNPTVPQPPRDIVSAPPLADAKVEGGSLPELMPPEQIATTEVRAPVASEPPLGVDASPSPTAETMERPVIGDAPDGVAPIPSGGFLDGVNRQRLPPPADSVGFGPTIAHGSEPEGERLLGPGDLPHARLDEIEAELGRKVPP